MNRASSQRRPFLSTGRPLIFAHRGSSSEFSDNSWQAFEAAVQEGVTHLELDVRGTKDGVALVTHDQSALRQYGLHQRVGSLSLAEINSALASSGSPRSAVTLPDLIERWPQLYLNIDLKDEASINPTVEAIRGHPPTIERVCLASFSDKRLRRARKLLGKSVCTALGPFEVAEMLLLTLLPRRLWLRRFRPSGDALQVPMYVNSFPQLGRLGKRRLLYRRLIDLAHTLDIDVHVWTLNDVTDMREAIEMGADGIMTDDPGRAKVLLAEGNGGGSRP